MPAAPRAKAEARVREPEPVRSLIVGLPGPPNPASEAAAGAAIAAALGVLKPRSFGDLQEVNRPAPRRSLTDRGLNGNDLLRIVKRRLKGAGLPEGSFCCHSFRATTAPNLLKQKVSLEQVQYFLGHSDARTTDLYNRTDKEVTRNIIERISI